jgi:hypothetical protein
MKKIQSLLVGLLLLTASLFGQSASTSPGTGHWVVIDSGYQVATSAVGQTVVPLYFYNSSTSEKITGLQYRVFYDKTAFVGVVPSLKIGSTDQYLQYVDSNAEGFVTITLAYTGSSSSFNYANGATFDLTFTHAAESIWNNLDSVKTLKINGLKSFTNRAATVYGNDTTLVVYSYGGRMNQKLLRFAAKFMNTTGTDSKNLWVSLEKRAKGSTTWTTAQTLATNSLGVVVFKKFIDTTYWDVRMSIKGDTMTPGSVYSTADAQKINQTVLGQYTPKGFDFYSMDVNAADGVITIADVYSVYGRLAGRFSAWPNSKKDILFFTVAEFNSINGSSSNLTSSITGATNLYYYVDGKDSITYYINVRGDANQTGFKRARLTPIKIVNPANAKNYIIDKTVTYDDPSLSTIEVNMPKVKVEDGNLVNVPVKVKTNNKDLTALQLDLKYDTALLIFNKIEVTEKIMKWTSFINPSNGKITWGGADLTNANLLKDGEQVFTLQFTAKRPQDSWATAALWTAEKYVGDKDAKDMNITPAMGIIEVRRKGIVSINQIQDLIAFPNPTEGAIQVQFKIVEESDVNLSLYNEVGQLVQNILDKHMPAGQFKYNVDLQRLPDGMYILTLKTQKQTLDSKLLII